MIISNKLHSIVLGATLSLALLAVSGACSSDGDDEDQAEETASATNTTGTVYAPGSTSAAAGASIAGGALNLSSMPSPSDAISTSSGASGLYAVSGTPPAFSDIKPSTLEDYLTGSITTLISNINNEVKKGSVDWNTVDNYIDTFQAGQTKCRIMENAARQLADLKGQTTSTCYMRNIDKPTGSLMTWVAGASDIPAGGFFAVKDGTTEDAPIVRELQIPADGESPAENIRFHISNNNNIYKVIITFCDSNNNARGADIISVNANSGSEQMTYEVFQSGTDTYNGQSQTFSFQGVIEAGVKSQVSGSNVSLVFDDTKVKTMTMGGSFSSSEFEDSFNGQMSIAANGSDLINKFIAKGKGSFSGTTFEHSVKSYSEVRFTGTSSSDVKIFEGAGRTTGTFKDSTRTETDSFDEKIGFEYQDSASPKYATTTSGTYVTNVNAFDFAADAITGLTAPASPTASIASSDRCAGSVDDGTVQASYLLDVTSEAFAAIDQTCSNEFSEGKNICNALEEQEQQVWNALRQSEAAK